MHLTSRLLAASSLLVLTVSTLFLYRRRLLPWLARGRGLNSNSSSSTTTGSKTTAACPDEAAQARRTDLVLLGHLLNSRLVAAGICPPKSGLARIWRTQIVPAAVPEDCSWQLGMTAAIAGLTSAAGQQFNGRVGRIAEHAADGRWQLLVRGAQGIGTVNLRPQNLKAATDLAAVLETWRDIPNRSQVPQEKVAKTDTRALDAVARRDGPRLRELVREGADLAGTNAEGRTALHLVLEMIEDSAGLGGCAVCDDQTEVGAGTAAGAAGEEDDPWSKLLAADGGLPRAPAPRTDELQLLRELLVLSASGEARKDGAKGGVPAHVNARDRHQRTPLHCAVRAGLLEAARLLLQAHGDLTLADSQGNRCLHEAAIRGEAELVELLLPPLPMAQSASPLPGVNERGQGGWTPLGLAARSGNQAVVAALLARGADPDVEAFQGKTPLQIAQCNERSAVAELLLAGRTP